MLLCGRMTAAATDRLLRRIYVPWKYEPFSGRELLMIDCHHYCPSLSQYLVFSAKELPLLALRMHHFFNDLWWCRP